MSKIEKFFSGNKLINLAIVLFIVGYAEAFVMDCMGNPTDAISDMILLILVIVLFWAFAKGHTQAMHTLIGAVMIIFLYSFVMKAVTTLSAPVVNLSDIFGVVLPIINAALYVILFITHLSLNLTHHSARGRVLFNQIITIIMMIYQIIVIILVASASNSSSLTVVVIGKGIGQIFLLAIIISIETKLNAYKLVREDSLEKGTWTDEKKEETKKEFFS